MPRKFLPEEMEKQVRDYQRPGLEARLWLANNPLYPEPRKVRQGINKILTAPTDLGEQAALKLCGGLLEDSDYDLLVNETGMVKTPDGEILPSC